MTTPSNHPLAHPKYRGDIDGLRAVAVVSVLVFHAFPAWLPGGFVGVDVFFVISGYLISTIILGNLAQGNFSFTQFYIRRIRRIFPALAAVLAFCLIAGWFTLYADDYAQLGKHVAGGAGFVSNLVLWNESGYFDQAAKLKPLLHLWSLGIEEQFYLLWPLVLYLGWRGGLGAGKVVSGIALISLAISLWMTQQDPVAAFYTPWSRCWELMAGVLLAVLHLHHQQLQVQRGHGDLPTEERIALGIAHAMSLTGAALIVIACFALRESAPFPGWRALLPVAGTCLLIAAGHGGAVNRWLLSRAAMRWVGQISYPLYLWHWPLLAYLNIQYPDGATHAMRGYALAASFVLAAVTYYVIERPLRFGGRMRAKTLGLLMAIAALAAAGLLVMANRGFVGRFPSAVALYTNYGYDFRSDARIGTCWLNNRAAASAYAEECVDPERPGTPLLLLWGDSHAGRLYPGVRILAKDRIRIAEYVRNACPPYLSHTNAKCLRNNRYVLSQVTALKPNVVMLFAIWNHDNPPPDTVLSLLSTTIQQLRKAGATRIVVLGPAPQWQPALPKSLLQMYEQNPYSRPPRRMAYGQVATAHELDAYLADHFDGMPDVTYLSAIDALCDASGCLTWVNAPEQLTTWDYGHLTTPGAVYLAKKLDLVGRTSRDDW